MSELKYIECAKIINTHGCRGSIKLESWCNTPEDLAKIKNVYLLENGEYTKHRVLKSSIFKQFVLMDLDGIEDMDTAISLKNKVVYAERKEFKLEKGEFFIADMIGIDVIDFESGKIYGKLTDIINRGASDIYVVDTASGEKMIPAVDEFIMNIDIKKGIFVKNIPGLLD